jgi:hypothetical protein
MPKDDARREPLPDDEPSRLMRVVMADPLFRRSVIEILLASADELGLPEPLGREGVARVQADPVFLSRLQALAIATIEAQA